MNRINSTPLQKRDCSWAPALNIVGDTWSMLIVSAAFAGVSKFSDFQRDIGMSKNILANRLDTLCKYEIMERVPKRKGSRRKVYVLTSRGQALFPIVVAIGQWGDKWLFGGKGEPTRILDKETGSPVQTVAVFSHSGRYLSPYDVTMEAGPGASERSTSHLARLSKASNV
ncbi:winged helix-turn-helix transcriptional regulator [Ruegeria jejuensis]|uniref:winged helix-turn-helix transcriptional regulator n=1 Tax=Ruegeria jejuensis TaxID=3233338 RepID=UPI00355C19F0